MSQQTQTLSHQIQQHAKQIIADTIPQHPKLYQAADALGIRYCTLWRKMKRYGICG
ncbi:MAG: helix-turn-helix domain-containing protein [Planktomarina sp.]|nr:helix-turn-helix domain-containing protein [Planktomarina sp.]